jgi:hypothetical protein
MFKKNIVFALIVFNLLFASHNLFSECEKKKISCVLEVIERAWNKRDGGYVSIVNTAIVELMVLAPRETVEWIYSKKEIEEELVSEWQILVFTDYVGDREDELGMLKNSLIKSLENAVFDKAELIQLKKRLLTSLKNIGIRKID